MSMQFVKWYMRFANFFNFLLVRRWKKNGRKEHDDVCFLFPCSVFLYFFGGRRGRRIGERGLIYGKAYIKVRNLGLSTWFWRATAAAVLCLYLVAVLLMKLLSLILLLLLL